ncbi:2-hydroxychromene-2-carboxylate isomerase [Pontivivens insulae]|uniref:2-hydroxychromene-2-carboxylate isomerase n=1 Tax=Pontivivens insulae TaxID=1639689 RepID=A0A2R8A8I3_9RHOB|nr:2-hydroxychromene-2-carboxylate isomerase [Pontivivens insulae]RED18649.1 2-hydroxychromene-2-carboxylate isomerase [Pontivivens insulae]SPF28547.1 2-hydroxychromene-2-carboxylate isomerase [Pontivivens insulae]
MATIDYYTFPLSPFAYLAGEQLEAVAASHGATINYIPFDLLKVFGEQGTQPPGKRHPSRQAYRLQELARVAKMNGLEINLKPAHWPTDPKPAVIAMINAQSAEGGDLGKLTHGILRAVWAEEKDISQLEVIEACLTAAGYDASVAHGDAEAALAQFERNTVTAMDAGVFGAPTYIVDDQVYWGQDRLSYLDAYLAENA